MSPKVSINLCCYNSEKHLRETLESIVNQTYKDWELVIINDGSTDSTESIIKEYIEKGYPIIYHYQENHGLGYSRNEALKRSNGDYIAFIDHDDIWLPDKLSKQIICFEKYPEIDFIYTNFWLYYESHKKKVVNYRKRQPSGHVFEQFLYKYPVGLLTAMIRKKSLERLDNYFDDRLNLCEEYDLFMRLLYHTKAYYMDEPLAIYRIHSNMSSIRIKENYPVEETYVIYKLKKIDEANNNKYAKALNDALILIEFLKAKIELSKGNLEKARNYVNQYKSFSCKFLVLYCLTFSPKYFRNLIFRLWTRNFFCQA